jgi:hypothetical protein
MRKLVTVCVMFVGVVCCPKSLLAQQYSRIESGVGIESQTDSGLTAGPFGNFTYNLSPSLAIEGSGSFLPQFQKNAQLDSGRELLALGGVKMGWRGQKFGVYGKIDPGIASYSCGLWLGTYDDCQRRTHFALQYGAVAEYWLNPRTALRVDGAQTLIAEFDQVYLRQPNGFPAYIIPGHVAPHLDLRVSVVHSFGELQDAGSEQAPRDQTFDLGGLFALHPRVHILDSNLLPGPGGGMWGSWNFSKHYALDTSAFYEPQNDRTYTTLDGGHEVDAYIGLKAGIRRKRVGFFAKVRPGVNLFSHVIDSETPKQDVVLITYSKLPVFALDTGGIVEVYPSKHTILRFDAGDDTIFYPTRTTLYNGQPVTSPGSTAASILMTFGAGIRF